MSCISAVILVNRADGLNFELASGPRHVGHARGSKKAKFHHFAVAVIISLLARSCHPSKLCFAPTLLRTGRRAAC